MRNDGVAFGALAGGGPIVAVVVAAALAALLTYFAFNARRPLAWLPTGPARRRARWGTSSTASASAR